MGIIKASSLEQARKQVEKASRAGEQVAVQGRDIEFNRKILEMKKVSILVLQHKEGRDSLKQRDSGLNEVLCNIALDNKITLAIDFSELLVEDKKEKAKILSRIIQNIKLIKRAKCKLIIINKPEDELSLSAFLRVLGADSKLASEICETTIQ
jgi:RNase P/RNase MRP subunit p30